MENRCFRKIIESIKPRRYLIGAVVVSLLVIVFIAGHGKFESVKGERNFFAVGLTGVQHLGENFNISQYYLNGAGGDNVGREGGGGSNVCCIMLPEKWTPTLRAEVRWSVTDWSKENKAEIKSGDYRSLTSSSYKATVPIEKYDELGRVYVHFFSEGRVRVVSSSPGSESELHPIRRNDANAAKLAISGELVPALFTDAELAEMRRKYYKERSNSEH